MGKKTVQIGLNDGRTKEPVRKVGAELHDGVKIIPKKYAKSQDTGGGKGRVCEFT